MDKYFREVKFIAADGVTKLRVYGSQGKRGINLGVTTKKPSDGKTHVGCQETVETADEANARIDARVKEAQELGWLPRPEKASGRRSAFNAMPSPPAPAPTPDAPKTGPTPVRNGKK